MRNSPVFLLALFVLAIATAYLFSQENDKPGATNISITKSGSNADAAADSISQSQSQSNDPLAIVPAGQVQSEIENAIRREPGMHADAVAIKVSDDTIELSGNVNSGKEKLAIYRLAESFAINRHVKDLVTVGNRGTSEASAPMAAQKQARATDKSGATAEAANATQAQR